MKTMTKVLAAILCIFVVSACGSKFDSKKAEKLIEKYQNDKSSITADDVTDAINLCNALLDEMKAPVKEAMEATKKGDYTKAGELATKFQDKAKLADGLEKIISYGKYNNLIDEKGQKALDAYEKAQAEFNEEMGGMDF